MQTRLLSSLLGVSVLSLLFGLAAPHARADNGRHLGQLKHGHQGDEKHGGKWDRRMGYPRPYGGGYSYYPPFYGSNGDSGYSPRWGYGRGYLSPAYPPSYRPDYGYPPYLYEDDEDHFPRYYAPRYGPGWYPHGHYHHDNDQGDDDQGDDD